MLGLRSGSAPKTLASALSVRLPRGQLSASNPYMNQARPFSVLQARVITSARRCPCRFGGDAWGTVARRRTHRRDRSRPPPEHHVQPCRKCVRAGGRRPSLPETEIIKHFFRKRRRIHPLAHALYVPEKRYEIQGVWTLTGSLRANFVLVTQPGVAMRTVSCSRRLSKSRAPRFSISFSGRKISKDCSAFPHFPLTSSQLAKYDVKYLGKEQVDEIECYIFSGQAKNGLRRVKAYFDGIVWVDAKYLESREKLTGNG